MSDITEKLEASALDCNMASLPVIARHLRNAVSEIRNLQSERETLRAVVRAAEQMRDAIMCSTRRCHSWDRCAECLAMEAYDAARKLVSVPEVPAT